MQPYIRHTISISMGSGLPPVPPPQAANIMLPPPVHQQATEAPTIPAVPVLPAVTTLPVAPALPVLPPMPALPGLPPLQGLLSPQFAQNVVNQALGHVHSTATLSHADRQAPHRLDYPSFPHISSWSQNHVQVWPGTSSGSQNHAQVWSSTSSGSPNHAQVWLNNSSGSLSHTQVGPTTTSGSPNHAQVWPSTSSGNQNQAQVRVNPHVRSSQGLSHNVQSPIQRPVFSSALPPTRASAGRRLSPSSIASSLPSARTLVNTPARPVSGYGMRLWNNNETGESRQSSNYNVGGEPHERSQRNIQPRNDNHGHVQREQLQGNPKASSQSSSSSSTENCAICLDVLTDDSGNPKSKRTWSTQCKHSFHYKCIRKWIMEKQQCPVCRKPQTMKDCKQKK